MPDRDEDATSAERQTMPVEATLEDDVVAVEHAIEVYLKSPTDSARQMLDSALEVLDAQIERSDQYHLNTQHLARFGITTGYSVLGETSGHPIVDEVPNDELRLQIELVKAAKGLVRDPTPATFSALEDAHQSLAVERGTQ